MYARTSQERAGLGRLSSYPAFLLLREWEMAIYQVDIEKSLTVGGTNTVYWTNVYHVEADNSGDAINSGQGIVTAEKKVHLGSVSYTKMRVQATSPLAMSGTIVPLTGTGGRAGSSYLPLFNVFRVDFNVGGGRPSRKYLRGPVLPADVSNGAMQSAAITLINTYVTDLLNLSVVCDPQGQNFVSGALFPNCGMRQLRRGSKRKTTSVLGG